jgi:hypothetical protein
MQIDRSGAPFGQMGPRFTWLTARSSVVARARMSSLVSGLVHAGTDRSWLPRAMLGTP